LKISGRLQKNRDKLKVDRPAGRDFNPNSAKHEATVLITQKPLQDIKEAITDDVTILWAAEFLQGMPLK
jgi:hypothetical protein